MLDVVSLLFLVFPPDGWQVFLGVVSGVVKDRPKTPHELGISLVGNFYSLVDQLWHVVGTEKLELISVLELLAGNHFWELVLVYEAVPVPDEAVEVHPLVCL